MYPEITVNLGNLFLSMSDALDLASDSLALHQQRTALLAWEMARAAGLPRERQAKIFVAALLHDIGALSLEEKLELQRGQIEDIDLHCVRGAQLFEEVDLLSGAAPLVRHHHRTRQSWGPNLDRVGFDSQIILLADSVERAIDRDKYILHQDRHIKRRIKALAGDDLDTGLVDLFMEIAEREELWLDLMSPRLYSLLLHNGPFRRLEIDIDSIKDITEMFRYIIDFKTRFTATHSSGVAECAAVLAMLFGQTEAEVELLRIAGHLHDLGKIVVPNAILNKPGRLTREEFAIVKQHTYFTFSVLSTISGLRDLAEWAAYHHEKLDGSGYPFRRKAKDLNIGSRIMAVADIFTALTEDRPYRPGMDNGKISRILKEQADDGLLDWKVVDILLKDLPSISKSVKATQAQALEHYESKFGVKVAA